MIWRLASNEKTPTKIQLQKKRDTMTISEFPTPEILDQIQKTYNDLMEASRKLELK